MNLRKLTILIACLSFYLNAIGQNIINFNSDNGLSNTCIRSLYEDSRHNVWVCTYNGLNLYDGAKINIISEDAPEGYALKSSFPTCVIEMDNHNMLIGLDCGLQMMNCETGKLTDVPLLSFGGDTITGHVMNMTRLKDGNIYAVTSGYGVFKVEQGNDKSICANRHKIADGIGQIRHIVEDRKGRVWVNCRDSLHLLNSQKNKIAKTYYLKTATNFIESSSGRLYASCEHDGLWTFDEKSKDFIRIESVNRGLTLANIKEIDKGDIYLCCDGNGLLIYNEKNDNVSLSDIKTNDYNLAVSNVKDVIKDHYGNLWVGVFWKGVLVKPAKTSAFQYIGRRSALYNTIGTNSVTAIFPDTNGWIWVATDNCGLYYMKSDGSESQHYKNQSNGQPGNFINTPNMPSTIMSIYKDSEGHLWLGGSLSGVVRMTPGSNVCTPMEKLCDNSGDLQYIYSIAEDSHKTIWFGTMGNGLFSYNLTTGKLSRFKVKNQGKEPEGYNMLYNVYINNLLIDGNRLYVCTCDGIEIFTITPNSMLKFEKRILERHNVAHISLDKNNKAWVSTNYGLAEVNTKDFSYKLITTANGLPTNNLCGAEIGSDGKVWISSQNGMACYNPKDSSITCYRIEDGLQGNEFNKHANNKTSGMLYFGGINGITYFNPVHINQQTSASPLELRFTAFYVNNNKIHSGDKSGMFTTYEGWLNENPEVNLCHNDNTFSIELSTMQLGNQHVTYYYRVNKGEWTALGPGQKTINFTNMKSGKYIVQVRAESMDRKSETRTFTVDVHPAWYASPWAKMAYLLLLGFGLYLIYKQMQERLKAKRILQKHKEEEKLNEARIQFFMNISHEIRTPMTLITSPLEKLMKNDNDKERQRSYSLIYTNAQRILRLINQLMDVRKIEKGQFKLKYGKEDVVKILQNLYDLFKSSADQRNIKFEFLHDGIEKLPVYIDGQNLDKVMMNLLSNAFKFTPNGGNVIMSLKESVVKKKNNDEEYFEVAVTDSGVGIDKDDKKKVFDRFFSSSHENGYIGTGIGLNLSQMLVNLHGGEISVADNPSGQGTQFTVKIPKGLELMEDITDDTVAASETAQEAKPEEKSEPQRLLEEMLPMEKLKGVKHKNVLVVEDDTAIRQYIHSELSKDFVITECCNGQEAWNIAQKAPGKVDLIISDVMMPVMDGIQLCQNIKSNYNTSHIPLIMLTAKSDDQDKIEGINIGADAYITKPFNMEILRTTVANLLHTRNILQGKYNTEKHTEESIDNVELTSPDERLMNRVMKVINENLSNPNLSVEFIADKVGISRVHFHRKMKELTGQSPRDFVKNIRMKQAAKLLETKHHDITDVSIAVGFQSISSFSTSFKSIYGMSPTEYMKAHQSSQS